jgi:hypothetical protein
MGTAGVVIALVVAVAEDMSPAVATVVDALTPPTVDAAQRERAPIAAAAPVPRRHVVARPGVARRMVARRMVRLITQPRMAAPLTVAADRMAEANIASLSCRFNGA